MTSFNVHIYREMRLKFDGIEADTPEAAAAIARDKRTSDAGDIEDCDGDDLGALVDEAQDEHYQRSVMIDFEIERQRKAAPNMLAALLAFIEADAMAGECHEWKWENLEPAFSQARAAIAQANAASIPSSSSDIDIHAHLAERRQIAVIWSIEDVQGDRPDLSDEQAWEVLQHTRQAHDAGIGINWDVLKCHAQMLFGDVPKSDAAEEAKP